MLTSTRVPAVRLATLNALPLAGVALPAVVAEWEVRNGEWECLSGFLLREADSLFVCLSIGGNSYNLSHTFLFFPLKKSPHLF